MTSPADDDRDPAPREPVRVEAGRRRDLVVVGLVGVALVAAIAAGVVGFVLPGARPGGTDDPAGAVAATPGGATPPVAESSGAPSPSAVAGASPLATPSPLAGATPSPLAGQPGTGRIAIVARDGSLAVVDDRGGPVLDLALPGVTFGPPAWSPDGTRLAAIGTAEAGARLHVFDVPPGAAGDPDGGRVVYESDDQPPFYLSWAPDGERVGFLATEADSITLRTAPADGGQPTDGAAGDGILREGAPLYFDWQGGSRLLLHVGFGAEAFTGQVDLGGEALGEALAGTGDFRTAVSSADGGALAFVRGGAQGGELVVADGDGATRHELAVFGPAAMAFEPGGDTLAVIAADEAAAEPIPFPLGPLRLVDGEGAVTTLVDDPVVGFYWSPDGRTIAALRLVDAGGGSSAATSGVIAAVAEPEPVIAVHLAFVDAASGVVRSDREVSLGSGYVSTILPYFDQYALSHDVWAPDGSAIVLPLEAEDGTPTVTVLAVDGADDRPIADGLHAAWAP